MCRHASGGTSMATRETFALRGQMKVTPLAIADVLLIELNVYEDERGFFIARYEAEQFRQYGLPIEFVQDNHSRSRPGVLRGLHFQHTPAQGKRSEERRVGKECIDRVTT